VDRDVQQQRRSDSEHVLEHGHDCDLMGDEPKRREEGRISSWMLRVADDVLLCVLGVRG